jgi:solute carrier family 25 S-adenosylmethionine transporter 26
MLLRVLSPQRGSHRCGACLDATQAPRGFYASGGFRGVYNGIFAAAAGSAPGAAIFFSTYETVKSNLTTRFDASYHPMCYMASSAVGEVAACWIRVPTENIKQKMQAGMYTNTSECLRGIYRQGRVQGFYRGYSATVMREIPFSFIQFPIYEMLKKRWAQWQGSEVVPLQSAVCGSIGGGISAAITTPLDVVKTRMMLGADCRGTHYKGIRDTVHRIYGA